MPASAIRLEPRSQLFQEFEGEIYLAQGRSAEAATAFGQCLKRQPGALGRLFSTHPMDADRIDKTQQEIQKILPAKPEYVVTTSEYQTVRDRLIALAALPAAPVTADPRTAAPGMAEPTPSA